MKRGSQKNMNNPTSGIDGKVPQSRSRNIMMIN